LFNIRKYYGSITSRAEISQRWSIDAFEGNQLDLVFKEDKLLYRREGDGVHLIRACDFAG